MLIVLVPCGATSGELIGNLVNVSLGWRIYIHVVCPAIELYNSQIEKIVWRLTLPKFTDLMSCDAGRQDLMLMLVYHVVKTKQSVTCTIV